MQRLLCQCGFQKALLFQQRRDGKSSFPAVPALLEPGCSGLRAEPLTMAFLMANNNNSSPRCCWPGDLWKIYVSYFQCNHYYPHRCGHGGRKGTNNLSKINHTCELMAEIESSSQGRAFNTRRDSLSLGEAQVFLYDTGGMRVRLCKIIMFVRSVFLPGLRIAVCSAGCIGDALPKTKVETWEFTKVT